MTNGSITEDDKKFVETWENIAVGTLGIIRLNPRGDEKHEMIEGSRTFMITTEERVITQDRIAIKDLDPFLNGSFRPVVVPDSVTVQSNPNALSDTEIKKILTASDIAWDEWLSQIDSVATVRRMIDLAEDADISVRRLRRLEERLVEVRPLARIESNDPHLKKFLADGAKEPAPKPVRSRGGRSSDYR